MRNTMRPRMPARRPSSRARRACWLTGAVGLVGAAVAALAAEAAIAGSATYLARDIWRPASRQLRNLVAATVAAAGAAAGVALIVDLLSPGVVGVLLGCGIGAASGWVVVARLDRPLQLGVGPI